MKRKLFFLITSWLLFSSFILAQESVSFIKRTELKLDESLTNVSTFVYSRPQKIYITNIKPNHNHLLNRSDVWIRLFHYYGATRLGLPDIPYNYIVDRSGDIYETLENSEGRKPSVEIEEGGVLIGYLSDTSDLTIPAQRAFKELVENYSYKFGISGERIEVIDLDLIEEENVKLSYKAPESSFSANALNMIQSFQFSEQSNLRFSGQISELKYEESFNSGEKLKVDFVLKNTDSYPWYVDDSFVFLSTSDGEESIFAVNQVWDSFSKPFSLDSQVVLPGQELDLSFELDSEGVLPGVYIQGFKFVMLPDIDIAGTEFEIEFELKKGERKIVQIKPTGTGALTVYDCPEYTCEMVAAAKSGQRYLVVEELDRWYKISVDGVEGYVTIHYATLVD